MPEVKILKPLWHEGRRKDPGTVIDIAESDAAYLVGIGRVERIDTIDEVDAIDAPTTARKRKK